MKTQSFSRQNNNRARRPGHVFGLLLTLGIVSWQAQASASDLDQVELHDGGLVRGEIVALDVGDKVVISVPGEEEPRVIPWADVENVKRARDNEADTQDDDGEADDEDEEAEEQSAPTVHLHVEADDPDVEVHSVLGVSTGVVAGYSAVAIHTKLECRAPCDRELETNRRYFFAGPGITSSDLFSLGGRGDDVTARVEAGSAGLYYGGWMATSFGGAALLTGAILTGMGYAPEGSLLSLESGKIAGPALLGAGAGVLAGGIIMLVFSGTDFEIEAETAAVGGMEIPTGRIRF